jgi:hypothetical protein
MQTDGIQTNRHYRETDTVSDSPISTISVILSRSEGRGGQRNREREKECAREREKGRVRELAPVGQTDRPQFSHSLALWLKKSITCLLLG